VEVDFIVDDLRCAIESKASPSIKDAHLKGLRELVKDHPETRRRIVVCLEPESRRTADGIEILGVRDFLDSLWSGGIV